MSTHTAALLAAMATMIQGYRLDVSCSPIDYARSLNRNKQRKQKKKKV